MKGLLKMIFKKKVFLIQWIEKESCKKREVGIFTRSKLKAMKFLFKEYAVGKILSVTEVKLF